MLKVELVHKAWYYSKIRNTFTFQISSKFCVWYARGICKKITSNFKRPLRVFWNWKMNNQVNTWMQNTFLE